MGGGLPPKRRRMPYGMGQVRTGSDECDLTFTVDLIGVRRDATRGLQAGDVLEVDLVAGAGASTAVCRTADGATVGALAAFRGLVSLLGCLGQGVRFEALIEDVGATRCTVTVTRAEA